VKRAPRHAALGPFSLARLAALGFVFEALVGKKHLFTGGKNEFSPHSEHFSTLSWYSMSALPGHVAGKVLKCSECGAEFVFTAGEQMFFATRASKTNQALQVLPRLNGPRAAVAGARFTDALGNEDQIARSAGRKRQFPSVPRKGARCFAGNASAAQGDGAVDPRDFRLEK